MSVSFLVIFPANKFNCIGTFRILLKIARPRKEKQTRHFRQLISFYKFVLDVFCGAVRTLFRRTAGLARNIPVPMIIKIFCDEFARWMLACEESLIATSWMLFAECLWAIHASRIIRPFQLKHTQQENWITLAHFSCSCPRAAKWKKYNEIQAFSERQKVKCYRGSS